jgi:SAF domain
MTGLSALLVFASIAAFVSVYARGNHRQSVLIVTQTIEQGRPITGADLGSASLSVSGAVHPILVSDAQLLSGRRAAVTIPTGSLLTMADTTAAQPVSPGDAVVGMALKGGQLPASGVEPGDQVMIIQTGAPGTPLVSSAQSSQSPADGIATPSSPGAGVLVSRATVFDIQPPPGGSGGSGGSSSSLGPPSPSTDSQLVSVEVAVSDAAVVSAAAAVGQVSLVLLPVSSGDAAQGAGNGSSQ